MRKWHPDYISFLEELKGKTLTDFIIKREPVFGYTYYRAYLNGGIVCGMPTAKEVKTYINMLLDRATKIN